MKNARTNNKKSSDYRASYRPHLFTQEGEEINLTVTVPNRISKLVKTEAAINNKSVSHTLLDILEQRYRLVD